ncbi:hypothetical protein Ancab_035509 [Ancistrocladus abbreviatus]
MVMMSPLEKVSPMVAPSDCWELSQSSLVRVKKLNSGMEVGSINLDSSLSRSANHNKKLWSDLYFDPTSCNLDGHPNCVNVAKKESSLFSSSLSDLFTKNKDAFHAVRLSSKNVGFCQIDSSINSQYNEAEAQTIKSLLPDEEELFSGMVDAVQLVSDTHIVDDSEDFDLFNCSGGIELEARDGLRTENGNLDFKRGISNSQGNSDGMVSGGHLSVLSFSPHLSNGASLHEASRVMKYVHYPIKLTPPGNQVGTCDSSHSLGQLMLENWHAPMLNSHFVPQVFDSSSNGSRQNSSDNMVGDSGNFYFKGTEKITGGMQQVGSNDLPMELGQGAIGYSPDRSHPFHMPQCVPSKSSPSAHHPSRSLFLPSMPSYINDRAHCPPQLPGFPSMPHLVMNTGSPIHIHQVGSAPVINVPLWDNRQAYAGESLEASSLHSRSIRNIGVPGPSPSYPLDASSCNISSHPSGINMDLSKNPRLLSSQQMHHMFHGRSPYSTTPSSFAYPCERVRNRRNEVNSNYADKKQYELNIDRILRGEDTRTTLMIKNIPNKYTSKMLLATIDEHHRGMYDFIYLPIDFKNKCNMGYAFINIVEPLHIVPFYKTFDGKKWEKFNSEKVASLAYARIQGKAALIAHFQNSSLMNEDKRCRPILFHTDGPNAGDQEPFPMGADIQSRPGKLQTICKDEDDHRSQIKFWGTEESSSGTDSPFGSAKCLS